MLEEAERRHVWEQNLLAGRMWGFWSRELSADLLLLGVTAHASSLLKRKLVGRTLPDAFQTKSARSGFGPSNWPSLESLLIQESLGYRQWERKHFEVVSCRCTGQARLA